ncbi:MAG: hypothetical protein V1649_03420, partial [Patescibacteria group bacterium]
MKIGYITTASKGARTDFNQKLKIVIRGEGYSLDEIDIEGKSEEEIKTLKYPIKILRDGQGILVDDNKYTFIGDGEEVLLGSVFRRQTY